MLRSREHGGIIITPESGPKIELGTLQCCHCGCHFPIIKGSRKKRGWCLKHGDVTCGQPQCEGCPKRA